MVIGPYYISVWIAIYNKTWEPTLDYPPLEIVRT